jgi:hypothetical protein
MKILKKFDDYGHEVNINFGRKGERVNTALGGVLSLIFRILTLLYLMR